jgi:micrococcal nuclease
MKITLSLHPIFSWKTVIMLFVITLSLHCNDIFAKTTKKWTLVKIERVIDNQNFLLFDGRVIQVIGVDPPDLFDPRKKDQCFSRNTFRLLKILLEKKDIKILEDQTQKTNNGIFPRHIKLEDGKLLAEFMLKNGMARFKSTPPDTKYNKVFRKAEAGAIEKNIGIWEQCGIQKSLILQKETAGRARQNFRKKFGQFLSKISVGRVEKVFSGTEFLLTNGLKVKMIGIQSPAPDDKRTGFSCFGKASKSFLESLILDRKVHLIRDISQFSGTQTLFRYVNLPPRNKNEAEIFVNKTMITEGYARSFWLNPDQYYKKDFEKKQKELYASPKGAWVKCIRKILTLADPKESLDIDADCPIKGNISGTKASPVKKFHTPKSRWYKNLKAEKCFQTEEAAIFAGFVKVK